MRAIDINNDDLYEYKKDRQRTKQRLQQLIDLGCEEIGVFSFGIKDVFSGLYIEKVWSYSEKDWNDYMDFTNKLIKNSKK
jgi:hypothetical protein